MDACNRTIPYVIRHTSYLIHCGHWRHMATKAWVNVGSGNGLSSDGTRPWPETMLTSHRRGLWRSNQNNFKRSAEIFAWWRHQMETFSALLAICAGNSPVSGELPAQRPVTRSFDVFFDLRSNKRLSKQWRGCWFETQLCPLWRHRNGGLENDTLKVVLHLRGGRHNSGSVMSSPYY